MTCNHKWIGDTCTECGIMWSVWAKEQIIRLNNELENTQYWRSLTLRAIRYAVNNKRPKRQSNWVVVRDLLSVGSSHAGALCDEAGVERHD